MFNATDYQRFDFCHFLGSELGVAVQLTAGKCSMNDGVLAIPADCIPSKITEAVIGRIAVREVAGLHSFGAWANKSKQYQSVNSDIFGFSVPVQSNNKMIGVFAGAAFQDATRLDVPMTAIASNSSMRGDAVDALVTDYGEPSFISGCCVHGRLYPDVAGAA